MTDKYVLGVNPPTPDTVILTCAADGCDRKEAVSLSEVIHWNEERYDLPNAWRVECMDGDDILLCPGHMVREIPRKWEIVPRTIAVENAEGSPDDG